MNDILKAALVCLALWPWNGGAADSTSEWVKKVTLKAETPNKWIERHMEKVAAELNEPAILTAARGVEPLPQQILDSAGWPTDWAEPNELPAVPCVYPKQGVELRTKRNTNENDVFWYADGGHLFRKQNGGSAVWSAPNEAGSYTVRVLVIERTAGGKSGIHEWTIKVC